MTRAPPSGELIHASANAIRAAQGLPSVDWMFWRAACDCDIRVMEHFFDHSIDEKMVDQKSPYHPTCPTCLVLLDDAMEKRGQTTDTDPHGLLRTEAEEMARRRIKRENAAIKASGTRIRNHYR